MGKMTGWVGSVWGEVETRKEKAERIVVSEEGRAVGWGGRWNGWEGALMGQPTNTTTSHKRDVLSALEINCLTPN